MKNVAGTLLPAGRFAGRTLRVRALPRMRLIETTYAAGEALPRHAHEFGHICLVLEGSYAETVHDQVGRREPLALSYLPEGAPHDEVHRTPGRHFIMEFGEPAAELRGDDRGAREPRTLDLDGALLAARLYAAFRADRGLGDDAVDLAWELLALCDAPRFRDRPAWLRRTRDALRERYRASLHLATLATEANVHPVHLAQTFRRIYGCTIGQFLRRLRVAHACRELHRGALPLSAIACDAGFADQSHLTRCFRAAMGTTPAAYRRAVTMPYDPKGVQDDA